MPNLALFDFDGTISYDDTFTPFLYFAVERRRIRLGRIFLAPLVLAYRLGLVPATVVRGCVAWVGFRGRSRADVLKVGERYARTALPKMIRPDALERIRWHKAQGDTVAVVSASLDAYLAPWCASMGLDLICTTLKADQQGVLYGCYLDGDCTGEEKARRVRARYDLESFPVVYAYGDTHEDEALLALAHRRYYRWVERDTARQERVTPPHAR